MASGENQQQEAEPSEDREKLVFVKRPSVIINRETARAPG